jgi:hypothetical protein
MNLALPGRPGEIRTIEIRARHDDRLRAKFANRRDGGAANAFSFFWVDALYGRTIKPSAKHFSPDCRDIQEDRPLSRAGSQEVTFSDLSVKTLCFGLGFRRN